MFFKIQVLSILFSFIFLGIITKLIIKGKLRIEYSIVWLFCTIILVIFSFWRQGIEKVAFLLDVNYPPALFFFGAILVILTFLIHLSLVNSKQHLQIKNLAQEIALLKQKYKPKS